NRAAPDGGADGGKDGIQARPDGKKDRQDVATDKPDGARLDQAAVAVVDGGFQTISRRGQQKRDPEQRGSSIRILEQVAQQGQRSKRELVVRGGGHRRERPGV